MSKLANPWKCDNQACGVLRANDTNHWLIVAFIRAARKGEVLIVQDDPDRPLPELPDVFPRVVIQPWDDWSAEAANAKHACGIDCGLRIAAALIADNFFPGDSPAGKEGSHAH